MQTAILGNAGSGKSTLARAIAARAGVPVLDLDTIFWRRDQIAVPRPHDEVLADLARYCAQHAEWVIEGCYGTLVEATFAHTPRLILLHPGVDACVANCRARPWEPGKYKSKDEQDSYLEMLLAWVAAYYERDGDMSLKGHLALFDSYGGPKELLTELPALADV